MVDGCCSGRSGCCCMFVLRELACGSYHNGIVTTGVWCCSDCLGCFVERDSCDSGGKETTTIAWVVGLVAINYLIMVWWLLWFYCRENEDCCG